VKRLVEYRIDPEGKQTVVVEVDEPLEETGEERAGFLSWKSPTPASEDLEGSFDRITPAANLLMSKQLAEYLGFRWDGSGRDGLWASAKWREAYGLRDRRGRGRLLTDITEYNRQDVAATWEVLSRLLRRTGQLGSAEELRART
jgi:hypothetical protein